MKPSNYVYVELTNHNRQHKKQSSKRHKKGVHQLYLKKRLTMQWRIKQFSQKQGYSLINYMKNRPQIHPYVMKKYYEYQGEMIKYWGGGKYFKKMGRMDKVRYKQNKQKKVEQDKKGQKFRIFHNLQVKTLEQNIFSAFYAIKAVKKPRRNIQYCQF